MTEEQIELEVDQKDSMHGQFLIFSVGKEEFGVKIKDVTEIVSIQPVNVLPEVPKYIKGIINLRGKIIPVIDMRLRFKKKQIDYTDRTCIIVIETRQILAGLIVDQVAEVITIEDKNIAPPPDIRSNVGNKYISGIGKVGCDIKLLLDCEMLFNGEDEKCCQKSNKGG